MGVMCGAEPEKLAESFGAGRLQFVHFEKVKKLAGFSLVRFRCPTSGYWNFKKT